MVEVKGEVFVLLPAKRPPTPGEFQLVKKLLSPVPSNMRTKDKTE